MDIGLNAGAKAASFCHQGTSYEVDSRARIIIFDMAAVEADTQLQRRTSSRISAAAEPSRGLNREHGGLMSWPEHMYKRQQSQNEVTYNTYSKCR